MRRALGALLLGVTLATTACASDPDSVAAQAKAGDRKGYVAGDGTIEQVGTADRGNPVDLSGTTLTGTPWSAADVRGKVVVVNVWGSWCPPCVKETDDLQKSWQHFEAGGKVAFVGINFREPDVATGLAFTRKHKVTYPSVFDDAGTLLLALQGKANAVPTTLVLDPQGRIAARVSGPVTEATVNALVDDALAEKA